MCPLNSKDTKEQAIEYLDEMAGFGLVPTAVLPSHFLPMAGDDCTICETCVDRCLLDALYIDDDEERVMAAAEKCIGCGVCTLDCPEETLKLHRFERPEKPFNNTIEWFMTVADDNDWMPQ